MEGWICLFRKIQNWEWYSDTITFRVFIQLLLQANHQDKKWQGILIRRGQTFTSYRKIINNIGDKDITVQKVRTALNHLRLTGEITWKSTHKGLLITIEKYEEYQIDISKATVKKKDNQHENNSELAINNNEKNKKELLSHFEDIWKQYPNKKGKTKAKIFYFQWIKGRKVNNEIIRLTDMQMYIAVMKYKEECEENQAEEKFIKHRR